MKDVETPPKVDLRDEKELKELVKLLINPEIKTWIKKFNEQYPHWDNIRHYKLPNGIRNETVWRVVKLARAFEYRTINIAGTEFKHIMTDSILRTLRKLDQQLGGSLESKNDEIAPVATIQRYLVSSIMEEAIASSQLEGATTSREKAKEFLVEGKKPKDQSQQMILNNYKTMLFVKDMKSRELTQELILEAQSRITDGTIEERYVGKFRDNDEIKVFERSTGEMIWSPPAHVKIQKMVDDLCKFINEDREEFTHPIIKAIVLHFMIGYIHPFHDGNGRTGRSLFYWYMIKSGYWLSEYMPISRIIKRAHAQYARAYRFTETDENDITYFINFNLQKIDIALEEFKEYLKRKREETQRIKEMVKTGGNLKFRQADMVLRFMKNPAKKFSIGEIKKIYNIAYQTARTDLETLEKAHYCQKITEGRKFLYVYSGRSE